MSWKFAADAPIYLQVAEVIKLRILTGAYPPGTYIPSVRELAQEAAVNPNTMQKALSMLESTGLLTTHRNTGRIVTDNEDLIRCLRLEQARTYVDTCRKQLASLGFGREEIQSMLARWSDKSESEKE